MTRFRIRNKIFLSLLAVTLLFGLGMVLFAETVIQQKLHAKLRAKGVALAKRVAAESVDPVITERYFVLTMMFKDLMATETDILYGYVLDENGREVAHTFANGVPPALREAHRADLRRPYSARDLATDRGLVHDIAVPLLGGQIGVLHLGISDEAVRRDVHGIVLAVVLFSSAVLAVGMLASMVFSRLLTRPLMELTAAAEAYGRGETQQPLAITTADEVGELAEVFNSMIAKRQEAEAERERLIAELQVALEEVKTLSGLLPLCASCKKVRDDTGYWGQLEDYLRRHADVEISHGLCPDCAQKLYPDIWEKMQEKKDKAT